MAYTINSAKDSQGDEHTFLQRFAAAQPAIEAYKRSRGGDLESAFQAVTGTPWPSGRSVKIKSGVPQMTKDRTAKSVLGKYVALPAAMAAGGYMAAPAIMGAMGAGAGVAGGGLGTGALAAGATVPGAGMATGAGLSGGGAGFLGTLGKVALGGGKKFVGGGGQPNDANPQGTPDGSNFLGDMGALASGQTAGRAAGRAAEANLTMNHDDSRLRGERQGMRQMVAADLLGTMKPPTDPRAQKFLNPSTVSPETVAAMRAKGQAELYGGGMTALPDAGKTDSFLNVLGTVGQYGGALKKARTYF